MKLSSPSASYLDEAPSAADRSSAPQLIAASGEPVAIAQQAEQARRGLGDDGVDGDVAGAMRKLGDVAATLRLGQDDAVNIGDADQLEIVLVDARCRAG